jgi:hypothetical protein
MDDNNVQSCSDSCSLLCGVAAQAHIQPPVERWGRSGQCLDIVNDGANDKLTVAGCGDFSGQAWTLCHGRAGRYRLQTDFTGADGCLDVINDGVNDVRMTSCANVTGQHGS